MPLVSQTTKNLKGGISQQPDILRFPEQGAKQVNGWSSETEGLQRRPPMKHVKTLAPAGALGNAPYIHLINRDEQEQYYVIFTGTEIIVYDMDGKNYEVSYPFGRSYIECASPRDDLRMTTVADYTFITNRHTTVQSSGEFTNGGKWREDGDALINVRGGQYGRTLSVIINGADAAKVELPNGKDENDIQKMDAQWIAGELVRQMTESFGGKGWTFGSNSGYVSIKAPDNDSIRSLVTKDGYADQLINPITHYAQTFSKLPLHAPDRYMVKIVGDNTKTADQYYVVYDEKKQVWKETVGWNVETGLRNETMPWALVRNEHGGFDLRVIDWAKRVSGDEDTNPMPSLVGSTINDIFFFRNRLGFLSGENIILSRTSKYFNLFPASVANLSDDDPIDVAISHNRISILKYAVPFAEELLLWSDQAQFVLGAAGVLSANTVELNLTTQFDVQDMARPYGIGRGVYFASPRATYTSINRYYAVQDVTSVKNAEDMTAHVPSYIPNGVYSISGSATENFAAILTSGARNKIFMYKYLYLNEEIHQQSWSHWDFGYNVSIIACQCIGSTMHIIWQNATNVFMGRVVFIKNTLDFPEEPYRVYLDQKKVYEVTDDTYHEDINTTSITISNIYGGSFQRGRFSVVYQDGQLQTFDEPDEGWTPKSEVHLNGDVRGYIVIVGFNIPFTYEFSKFLIKQTAEDGSIATEDIGRLQLRRAWVNYEDSGAFDVTVENMGRKFKYTMAGGRLGSNLLRVGALNLGTGQFRFPVPGNALNTIVTLTSDNTTPLSLIGCGWEGNYVRRSNGV